MRKKTSVLITCRKGISRSATICIAYIMYEKNLNFKKALNFVGSKRMQIEPNEGFIK